MVPSESCLIFQNHQDASLGLFVRHGKKENTTKDEDEKGTRQGLYACCPLFVYVLFFRCHMKIQVIVYLELQTPVT